MARIVSRMTMPSAKEAIISMIGAAFRSRRKITKSVAMPKSPVRTMAIAAATGSGSPAPVASASARYAPIAANSRWAKLAKRSMPYVMVTPTASSDSSAVRIRLSNKT